MKAFLALVFLVVLSAAAVALAPLGAALSWAGVERLGLGAREATGTIWRGTLRDARYGPIRLGDVAVALDPFALATGRLRLRSRSEAGAFEGDATWIADGAGAGVDAVDGTLAPGFLRTPVPLPARIGLQGVSVRFRDGRCAAAEGRLSAGTLSGALRCAEGALAAPLQGRTPLGDTRLTILLNGDGGYRVETRVMGPDAATSASLRLTGFVDVGGVLMRTDEGRLARR